jgi:hypothetical protein
MSICALKKVVGRLAHGKGDGCTMTSGGEGSCGGGEAHRFKRWTTFCDSNGEAATECVARTDAVDCIDEEGRDARDLLPDGKDSPIGAEGDDGERDTGSNEGERLVRRGGWIAGRERGCFDLVGDEDRRQGEEFAGQFGDGGCVEEDGDAGRPGDPGSGDVAGHRDLELEEEGVRLFDCGGSSFHVVDCHGHVGHGDGDDAIATIIEDERDCRPGSGEGVATEVRDVDTRLFQGGGDASPEIIGANPADERHLVGAEAFGGDRLVGTFAAHEHVERVGEERLTGDRKAGNAGNEVNHAASEDGDSYGRHCVASLAASGGSATRVGSMHEQ